MDNPEVQLVIALLVLSGVAFVITFVLFFLATIVSQVVKNYLEKGSIPPEEAHLYHWFWGYTGPDRQTEVPWYQKPGNRLERDDS